MTTLVFPGQGSQFLGMSKDFYENFNSARKIFQKVENSTNINIKEIIFENRDNLLDITKYTQLCVFSASMAIFEVFKELFGKKDLFLDINYVLGHSLGEYSALVVSSAISLEDCSKLLKIRGELMQDAYPENQSGMAAVLGLNCKDIELIIKDFSLNIEVANDNTPEQVVISGIIEDINKAKEILILNGAKKFVNLNVSAAFHSRIMKKAEEKMKKSLSQVNFTDPLYPIISNYSATASKDKLIIIDNLSKQMSNRVNWVNSIKLLERENENIIIEIGPGKILTQIIRKISKNFNHFNVNEVNDIVVLNNAT